MYLPREEILWWKGEDPFALTTDEAFCSFKMTPVDYAQGKIDRFSSSYDYYNRFYKGIRRANQVIQRIHECDFRFYDTIHSAAFKQRSAGLVF